MKKRKLELVDETDDCKGCWFVGDASAEKCGCPQLREGIGLVCTTNNSIWVLRPVKE